MGVLTNVILRLGRETQVNSYYFIISHIKQSQSKRIRSCDEHLGANREVLFHEYLLRHQLCLRT